MHIALVGLSGTGKSTIARLLAAELARPLYDIDALIAQRTGTSIPTIFAAQGEPAFRAAEHAALLAASTLAPGIVATGAGIVVTPANHALLAQMLVVWLDAPPAVLAERLRNHDEQRPLLAGDDALARLTAQYQARTPLYIAVADLRLDVALRTPPAIVAAIVTHMAAVVLRTA